MIFVLLIIMVKVTMVKVDNIGSAMFIISNIILTAGHGALPHHHVNGQVRREYRAVRLLGDMAGGGNVKENLEK